jgi:hypothetical protein
MKKLLLVMLVPLLVLGVMGCGAKVPDGDGNPISLQGYWITDGTDDVDLVISGNQVTLLSNSATYLGNIALRTSYSGPHGTNEDGILQTGDEFTITFKWFDKPYDEIGSIKCTMDDDENFTVDEVKYQKYYQNVMLPSAGASYEKQ